MHAESATQVQVVNRDTLFGQGIYQGQQAVQGVNKRAELSEL